MACSPSRCSRSTASTSRRSACVELHNNRKYKHQFGVKARMLTGDEVVEWTGHPVGGVCPFGLPRELEIFVDVTLKKFDLVLPAAGATNAAVRIAPDRLAQLVRAQWVDVAQSPP